MQWSESCVFRSGGDSIRVCMDVLRGGYGDVMWHLVDDVELLDGELVDLVQHVDAGDVLAIALHRMRITWD